MGLSARPSNKALAADVARFVAGSQVRDHFASRATPLKRNMRLAEGAVNQPEMGTAADARLVYRGGAARLNGYSASRRR